MKVNLSHTLFLLGCCLCVLGDFCSLVAKQPDYIRQSVRARGMGNAFTAVANDEMVLYYNPAGLRSVTHNMYELLTFNATVNDNLLSINPDEILSDFAGFTGESLFFEGNLGFFSFTSPRWGFSTINSLYLDFVVHNPIYPYLGATLYIQGGFVGGYAMSFMDHTLDLGISLKYVNRVGFSKEIHTSDEWLLQVIESEGQETDKMEEEFPELINYIEAVQDGNLEAIRSTYKPGIDIGATYHIEQFSNFHIKTALVIRNFGGIEGDQLTIGKRKGQDFGELGTVPLQIDTGIASESEFQGFDLTLAVDYHDLTDNQDLASDVFTARNLKMGAEIGWEKMKNGHHFFSFRVGRNGPYETFGWTFNPNWTLLYIFPKIEYAYWGQEVGDFTGDNDDFRQSFSISWIF
jgi:hypothetical protein